MTRSSDKNSRWLERNMANDLLWELPLKLLLSSQKGLGRKKYPVAKLQKHINVMHFGKNYFEPLHVSLRSCGCI